MLLPARPSRFSDCPDPCCPPLTMRDGWLADSQALAGLTSVTDASSRNSCLPQLQFLSDISVKTLCPFCSSPVDPAELRCAECGADLHTEAGPPAAGSAEGDPPLPPEPAPGARIAQLLLEGRRLQAVREWQQATGCDLVEAVEAVDRISDRAGIPRPRGCAGILLLLGAILSACLVAAA